MEQFTDQIRGGEFQMLFDSFEAYDVQETRRISKAEGKAESIIDLLEDIGMVSENLKKRILQERDLDTLRKWNKAAARAESIEAFIREMDC